MRGCAVRDGVTGRVPESARLLLCAREDRCSRGLGNAAASSGVSETNDYKEMRMRDFMNIASSLRKIYRVFHGVPGRRVVEGKHV